MKNNLIRATLAVAAGAALIATPYTVQAQGAEELLLFSRQNFGISSARSAGMGGAFTSLGADAASMSINPAGMAMYGSGEVSVSPGLRITGRTADYSGSAGNVSNNLGNTKANVGSFSMVYASENFAVGFGMNRLADFNGRSRAIGYGENFSMGDMFVEQLYGVPTSGIGSPDRDIYQAFYNYPPAMWGAIMGYQTGMLDPVGGSTPPAYTMANMIQSGTLLYPEWYRRTSGAINEYTLSGGYNFQDVLYIGATLGIQDIYYNRFDTYSEITSANNVGLHSMYYDQNLRMSGAGVNLKVGATVRPLPWLRVGVAYHSPTWINMSEEYDANMTVFYTELKEGYDYGYSDTPILRNEYNLRTPSRLLAGVSATIGTLGIVSVDYERTWYQHMKYTSDGYADVNEQIKGTYGPSDVIRAGVEFQPITSLFLRAGYGYSTSVYQNKDYKQYGEYQQWSGGIGYRTRSVNIDLAYVYGSAKQMPFKPFDYTASDGYRVTTDGTIYTSDKNHNVILTVAFKF